MMATVPKRQRSVGLFTLLALGTLFIGLARPVIAQPARENELKAIFLINFLRYVDWPTSAFVSPSSPIVIGVMNNDPLGPALDRAVVGEQVGPRAIVVKHLQKSDGATDCHLCYLSAAQARRIGEMKSKWGNRPILTVSESDGFLEAGGMIRLYTGTDKKLKIVVQLDNLKAAGLKANSKLLRVAEVRGHRGNIPEGGIWKRSSEVELADFTPRDRSHPRFAEFPVAPKTLLDRPGLAGPVFHS